MDAPSPLLQAAKRKVLIAAFHCSQLEKYLMSEARSKAVPIPIQAHFEGVVVSVMAAVDQVAQAVNSALCLRATPGALVEQSFSMISDVPGVGEWYREQIGRDLRSIRTKIVHYSYTKDLRGVDFNVQEATKSYPGSRDLITYSREAVVYGERFRDLIPSIKARISRHEVAED